MKLTWNLFVLLQALDVMTTYIGITYLNLTEQNTFASGMFQEYVLINVLICMKLISLLVIYGVLSIYPLNIKKLALNIICLIYIGVVINNSYWLIMG
jgi:hypothetical protein